MIRKTDSIRGNQSVTSLVLFMVPDSSDGWFVAGQDLSQSRAQEDEVPRVPKDRALADAVHRRRGGKDLFRRLLRLSSQRRTNAILKRPFGIARMLWGSSSRPRFHRTKGEVRARECRCLGRSKVSLQIDCASFDMRPPGASSG
jgi:hypothetical protein